MMVSFTLTSLTIAEPVAAWLQAEPRRLRVHSAFPQAINLVSNDSQFLTLLAQDADDGPFALRLACPRLPDVPAGTPGHAAHGSISLGLLAIDWRSATRWDPTLKPIEKLNSSPLPVPAYLHQSDSLLVCALLARYPLTHLVQLWQRGEPDSPPPNLGEGTGVGADPPTFQKRLAIQATALLAGLQGDDTTLRRAVRSLLGFGEGLTPAGDDCLLGVLAARRMLGQPAGALEATIQGYASRTTALSGAFLRAGCAGQFADHWHHLRDALAAGEAEMIEEAAGRIITHGATSGADALTGWLVGVATSAPYGHGAG